MSTHPTGSHVIQALLRDKSPENVAGTTAALTALGLDVARWDHVVPVLRAARQALEAPHR